MMELLNRFNPWWRKEPEFPGIPRRKHLQRIDGLMKNDNIILITGLRRTGKTTLMKQMIHGLLSNGVKPEHILYVSLDNIGLKDRSIMDIESEYRQQIDPEEREVIYLFLDEVHFQENFEIQLKNLCDMGATKIIASGSANLDILMKTPYLTGRYRMIRLRPLDFSEYLLFKGYRVDEMGNEELIKLAHEYSLQGGIPEYVLTSDIDSLNTLLQSILYRDVFTRSGLRDKESLLDIFTMLVKSVSSPLSVRRISKVLKHSEDTVRKVIGMLEETNLLFKVERYGNFKERKSNPPKYYLADTGFFNVILDKVNVGAIVENLVFLKLSEYGAVHYHRAKGREIDFISNGIAYEVKYMELTSSKLKEAFSLISWKGKRRLIVKELPKDSTSSVYIPLFRLLLEEKVIR